MTGNVSLSVLDFQVRGTLAAKGQTLSTGKYPSLYRLYGNKFGGKAKSTFALPEITKTPIAKSHWQVSIEGDPLDSGIYLSELALTAEAKPPRGWVFAQGQPFDMKKNPALCSLIAKSGECKAPDLKGKEPVKGFRWIMAVDGVYPNRG